MQQIHPKKNWLQMLFKKYSFISSTHTANSKVIEEAANMFRSFFISIYFARFQ